MKTAVRACLLMAMGLLAAHCGNSDEANGVILPDGGSGSGTHGNNGDGGANGNGTNPDGSAWASLDGGANPWGALDGGADPWANPDGSPGTVTYGDGGLHGGGDGSASGGGDGSLWGGGGDGSASGGDAANGGEICGNGFDDNHNGLVDENCPCLPGTRQYCYPGTPSQAGVAGCNWGEQVCTGGEEIGNWGACTGAGHPTPEACDGQDNNCDGIVDEGCACTLGATRSCYTGPPGVPVMSPCHAGTATCVAGAGGTPGWSVCTGQITPMLEVCDGIDNNCNGVVDEGCICQYGSTRNCYTGAAGTEGVGACVGGIQTCQELPDGGSNWGACVGEVVPTAPTCGAGVDSMCDGHPDEGCPCRIGTTTSCYDGPSGTAGVGICHAGRSTCTAAGWGPCTGEQTPQTETCNGMDDNCTGVPDEWCLCGPSSSVTFHLRDFSHWGDRSMISIGDGFPLMTQDCGPMRCPSSEVAVETSAGVFACVAPPPACPAGSYPNYVVGRFWRCDRPCEMIITYGPLFHDLVECAPRPTLSCPSGLTPYYAFETETWVCRPQCNNGEYDLYHFGAIPICIPC